MAVSPNLSRTPRKIAITLKLWSIVLPHDYTSPRLSGLLASGTSVYAWWAGQVGMSLSAHPHRLSLLLLSPFLLQQTSVALLLQLLWMLLLLAWLLLLLLLLLPGEATIAA
jgi:hypothetical protein